jgi:hypothetical protein
VTRIISASPLLKITGTVACIFRGMATVARDDDRWCVVPIGDCEKEEAVNCGDGLSTTPAT